MLTQYRSAILNQGGVSGPVTRLVPAFRSVSSGGINNATTVTMTRPAGSVAGDLLLLVATSNRPTFTVPTGWTALSVSSGAIGTDTRSVYWRVSDGTATDLPAVTWGLSGTYGGGALFAIQNVDTSNPFPDAIPSVTVRSPADALAFAAPTVATPSEDTRVFSMNVSRSGGPATGASSGTLDGTTNINFIRASLASGANPNVFTFGTSQDSVAHSFSILGAVA